MTTNCRPQQITATIFASDGSVAEASDSFQATNCSKLTCKPKILPAG